MERKINKIEDLIKLTSDDKLTFVEKSKNFKKCQKSIKSCSKLLEEYENILASKDYEGIKDNHSIKVIEKELNDQNDELTIETLLEYLSSINNMKKNLS
ncbi:hypothetical protein CPAV1605_1064 [seawater metagenome]|uniref:Uncharacterized protein n=1 Tax=seawater metagenome TaxID=1561972 RepID=A0A5E8CIV5_9ZZZZ